MLKQGFSSVDASIGTPWISASAAVSGSDGRSDSSSKSRSYVTSIYRYPRAIVQVDVTKFDASPEFIGDRDKAFKEKDENGKRAALTKLFKKYGHVFAAHVELGGLLQSTHLTTTDQTDVQTTTERSVRAALSSQIQTFSGSVSVEFGDKSGSGNTKLNTADTLAVEAVGGDTTLASNPTLWPSSTIPYVNWRATKFSDVSLLTDIPLLFEPSHKDEVDRLFAPEIQDKAKEKTFIGFWVEKGHGQPIATGWFPAACESSTHILYIKPYPSLPDPPNTFAPPIGYNQVTDFRLCYYEPFAADTNYKAITVVEGAKEFPNRLDLSCVNEKYLEWVVESKREIPYYSWDPTSDEVKILSMDFMNKTKYQYGRWQFRLDMVDVVPQNVALGT